MSNISFSVSSNIVAGAISTTPSLIPSSQRGTKSLLITKPQAQAVTVTSITPSSYINFINKATDETLAQLMIISYSNGTNTAKFIKCPSLYLYQPKPLQSQFLLINQLKYSINDHDTVELKPIDDETITLIITRSPGNQLEIIQEINIKSKELILLIKDLNIKTILTNTGISVGYVKSDIYGNILTIDNNQSQRPIMRDLNRSTFELTPDCITTQYVAINAVTLEKCSSDIQLIVSNFSSDTARLSTITSEISDNMEKITTINTAISNILPMQESLVTNNDNIALITGQYNSDLTTVVGLESLVSTYTTNLTSNNSAVNTNTINITTLQTAIASDTGAYTSLNASIEATSDIPNNLNVLSNRITSDHVAIGNISTSTLTLQHQVTSDEATISDIHLNVVTTQSDLSSIIDLTPSALQACTDAITLLSIIGNEQLIINSISNNISSDVLPNINTLQSVVSDIAYNNRLIEISTIASNTSAQTTIIASQLSDIANLIALNLTNNSDINKLLENVNSDATLITELLNIQTSDTATISSLAISVTSDLNASTELHSDQFVEITDNSSTGSQTITVPQVNSIFYFTLCGGGGGGGGGAFYAGGGGGGSGVLTRGSSLCSPSTVITYTLGAGGTGGTGGSNATGGNGGVDGSGSVLIINGYQIGAGGGPSGNGAGGDYNNQGGSGRTGGTYPGGGGAGLASGGNGGSTTQNTVTIYGGNGTTVSSGNGYGNPIGALTYNNRKLGGNGGGPFGGYNTSDAVVTGQYGCGGSGGYVYTSTGSYTSDAVITTAGSNGGKGFISYYFVSM